jgi:hypothetical protein
LELGVPLSVSSYLVICIGAVTSVTPANVRFGSQADIQ